MFNGKLLCDRSGLPPRIDKFELSVSLSLDDFLLAPTPKGISDLPLIPPFEYAS